MWELPSATLSLLAVGGWAPRRKLPFAKTSLLHACRLQKSTLTVHSGVGSMFGGLMKPFLTSKLDAATKEQKENS